MEITWVEDWRSLFSENPEKEKRMSNKNVNLLKTANEYSIIYACKNNNIDDVKLYLKYCSIDVNYKNGQAIVNASNNNNLELIKLLFNKGAKLDVQNNKIMVIALKRQYIKIIEFLYNNGVKITWDIIKKSNDNKNSLNYELLERLKKNRLDKIHNTVVEIYIKSINTI